MKKSLTRFVIRNSIGSIVDQQEAEDAGMALARYAVKTGMCSPDLKAIGYRAERDRDQSTP